MKNIVIPIIIAIIIGQFLLILDIQASKNLYKKYYLDCYNTAMKSYDTLNSLNQRLEKLYIKAFLKELDNNHNKEPIKTKLKWTRNGDSIDTTPTWTGDATIN